MKTITDILESVTAVFTAGPTATGLDVLGTTPLPVAITRQLFERGLIPATPADIAKVHQELTGQTPDALETLDTEAFLLSYGMLA